MLWNWCFDPIAEASELPDHSRRAPLPRLFGDGRAPFFKAAGLVSPLASAFSMRRALAPSRSETRLDNLICASSRRDSNWFCSRSSEYRSASPESPFETSSGWIARYSEVISFQFSACRQSIQGYLWRLTSFVVRSEADTQAGELPKN